jgi:hypothetical protein
MAIPLNKKVRVIEKLSDSDLSAAESFVAKLTAHMSLLELEAYLLGINCSIEILLKCTSLQTASAELKSLTAMGIVTKNFIDYQRS